MPNWALRQITPRRSGTAHSKDAIEDVTVIHTRYAAWLVHQHRSDGGPFIVSEFIARDPTLLFWKLESRVYGPPRYGQHAPSLKGRRSGQIGRRPDYRTG
jgi:hypothetical protein